MAKQISLSFFLIFPNSIKSSEYIPVPVVNKLDENVVLVPGQLS